MRLISLLISVKDTTLFNFTRKEFTSECYFVVQGLNEVGDKTLTFQLLLDGRRMGNVGDPRLQISISTLRQRKGVERSFTLCDGLLASPDILKRTLKRRIKEY